MQTESTDAKDLTDIECSVMKRSKRSSITVNNTNISKAKKILNTPDDEYQIFGHFVASELRNMHYLKNRRELRHTIQRHIITWTEKDDKMQNMHSTAGPSHAQFSLIDEHNNSVHIDVNDLIDLPLNILSSGDDKQQDNRRELSVISYIQGFGKDTPENETNRSPEINKYN